MEAFCRSVLAIPVIQVVRGMSFEAAEQSSLDILTEVMGTFIEELGFRAQQTADMAGRNQSNLHDMIYGMGDLRIPFFDVITFCLKFDLKYDVGDITFPAPHELPYAMHLVERGNQLRTEHAASDPHIPSFLPPLPPDHTHLKTPIYEDLEMNPKKVRELKAQQSVQAENCLASLNQVSNGQRTVVHYDRVNDPKAGGDTEKLFKPAATIEEIVAARRKPQQKVVVASTPIQLNSQRVLQLVEGGGAPPPERPPEK